MSIDGLVAPDIEYSTPCVPSEGTTVNLTTSLSLTPLLLSSHTTMASPLLFKATAGRFSNWSSATRITSSKVPSAGKRRKRRSKFVEPVAESTAPLQTMAKSPLSLNVTLGSRWSRTVKSLSWVPLTSSVTRNSFPNGMPSAVNWRA